MDVRQMKREPNLDLLRFHVLEAKTELDELLLAIDHALGEPVARGGKWDLPDKPFDEWMLHGSLYHVYHHLNFAWNSRFKAADQAESQFDRNEKFPRREFERYWPKSVLRKKGKGKGK